MKNRAAIEEAISAETGVPAIVDSVTPQESGSINQTHVIGLRDGRQFFVKQNSVAAHYPGLFPAERKALEVLSAVGVIRVPMPLYASKDFIIMEAIEFFSPSDNWQECIGQQLANLHRATGRDMFGFESDNYLGTTPQINTLHSDWIAFWREYRLITQLDRFAASGNQGDRLVVLGWELCERVAEIIQEPDEPAVLLHGDLWSGNAACDIDGLPVIFDPASYYGRREAELGMMQLFGGFNRRCFDAYGEVWPLADGSGRRIAFYRLYHELNHLNCFGRSYYDMCMSTIRSIL